VSQLELLKRGDDARTLSLKFGEAYFKICDLIPKRVV
jgi:hypothetical protein